MFQFNQIIFQQFNQIYFQSYQYEDQTFSIQNQKILHVKTKADDQIRRLMNLFFITEKTFRILCIIKIGFLKIVIDKSEMQIDQDNDINVIFIKMIKKLFLKLFNLNSIEFRHLIMKITDYKKTSLLY